MDSFQNSFNLHKGSPDFANLQGNIVSVLQAGCFFGALASFYVSDTFGRKWALIIADIIFIVGSLIQTLCGLGTSNLAQLYVGRVIGGFGVGLISAVVPTYIGENAPRAIRGRCIGCMVWLLESNLVTRRGGLTKNNSNFSTSPASVCPFSSTTASLCTSPAPLIPPNGEYLLHCKCCLEPSCLRALFL